MGRPKGGINTNHSKEEKLALVKRNLAGERASDLERETGIYHAQIHKWTKQYLEGGEAALVNKRKPGNPLVKYTRKKELTPTEQLEYKIALLERELLKKDGEIVRLKKSIELERGRCQKKVIQQIYACIERESKTHSVTELCDVYEVSRSGYYKYCKHTFTKSVPTNNFVNCFFIAIAVQDACNDFCYRIIVGRVDFVEYHTSTSSTPYIRYISSISLLNCFSITLLEK